MQRLDYTAFDTSVSLSERLKVHSKKTLALGLAVAAVFLVMMVPAILNNARPNWFLLFVMALFAVAMVGSVYERAGQIVRLRRFAADNQLKFRSDANYDGRPGVIFGQGHSKTFLELLSFSGDDFLDIGNYRYTTGGGRHRTNHNYGFIKIKLPRRLPHMLLDSKKNNLLGGRISNLPVGFKKDQRISLEGDFDKYFTLYAPTEYKTDALYIFTPDVMQELIDSVHSYDVEIVDDNCYIFTPGRLALHDQAQLQEVLDIISRFKPELIDQADYYADKRIDDRSQNIIAEPGVRLKSGLPTLGKIIIGIFIAYFIWLFILRF